MKRPRKPLTRNGSTQRTSEEPRAAGIPRRFVVMGTTWKVEFSDTLQSDDDSWGNASARTRTITLDHIADEPVTFLHELIHAIEVGLNMDLEEAEVQGIARGLIAVLHDNRSVRRYLLEQA